MKNHFKFLLITVLLNVCLSKGSKCQIVLEQEYDSSAQQLQYVNFQINGEKYFRLIYPEFLSSTTTYTNPRKIDIYNLNHSLWKTIPLNFGFYPNTEWCYYEIVYLSDSLFATDNLIEFAFNMQHTKIVNGNPYAVFETYIYNENGSLLFSDTTADFFTHNLVVRPRFYNPIFNTSTGTKMVLNTRDSTAKSRVYSLPGQLSRESYGVLTGEVSNERTSMKMNLYPNPSSGNVTVEYDLPSDVPQADLVFYDMNGKKIKSFKIDHSFHNLYLSNNDLASGTYYCQIETAKGALGLKKLIHVDY